MAAMTDVDEMRAAAPVRWWLRPPVLALLITLGLLAATLSWPLLRWWWAPPPAAEAPAQGLPWQIQPDGQGGSRVFGLPLGTATLREVELLWNQDLKVALIAARGQTPALEAYVETFRAGFVTGKLVVALQPPAGWTAQAWERSPRGEVNAAQGGSGTVRQRELAPEDRLQARDWPVAALSFVPSARLDEATVLQRFGPGAERHAGPDGVVQLLYPALGVAVALPPAEGETARSRALIQYVAPRDFEARLRAPLAAAAAASGG